MSEDTDDIISDFQQLVNMIPTELERWLGPDEREAGSYGRSCYAARPRRSMRCSVPNEVPHKINPERPERSHGRRSGARSCGDITAG